MRRADCTLLCNLLEKIKNDHNEILDDINTSGKLEDETKRFIKLRKNV